MPYLEVAVPLRGTGIFLFTRDMEAARSTKGMNLKFSVYLNDLIIQIFPGRKNVSKINGELNFFICNNYFN